MQLFVLFETASGLCLFEVTEYDAAGGSLSKVQKAVNSLERFTKMVSLAAYQPFSTAEEALANIVANMECKVSDTLKNFLTAHLPATKTSKKQKYQLGISDPRLGKEIFDATGITASFNDTIVELMRGVRTHFSKIIKSKYSYLHREKRYKNSYINPSIPLLEISEEDLRKAQLGLSHQFSREKCALDVNRQDKPITQTIALIEQLDKDVNTFCMRLKEWFSWTFPELTKIVNDNIIFTKLVHMIERKENVVDELHAEIAAIVLDEEKATQIIEAAKTSMGQDMSETDVIQIKKWAERVTDLINFREELQVYLKDRMNAVAPNLAALIGETVGSKLISHAGSLTSLAKYPASTIQILGAEKALFRALKTKGKTPKYGLIFNSTFIGRASAANKGRISRYLANKCAIASRVDCFSEAPTTKFGESLKG